jgi:CelD/BcsL family acetyltransferase involved in cellulose biosynthesis
VSVRLLSGDDALARIGAAPFGAAWRTLYARCPWATGCQHPDFVLPWYALYGGRHEPVVVADEAADGTLRGLLTLALDRGRARLTGAGAVQAEYQGWIAEPDDADRFAADAMACIRAALPRACTTLKYLPPGIPLGWLDGGGRRYAVLRAHARPVMQIDEAAMDKLRRKKNHRQNANRLNRIGAVAFERVTGDARFRRVFEDICIQYDFRQAALYRQTPFASDPLKERFYLELHRRGMLHTTVLTVGGTLAAAHVGLVSKECVVHLGLNTHAPALAAHSPGLLLLALLGGRLADERVGLLDLTPGGDRYKEQFASAHDEVYELTMCGSRVQRLRAQAAAGVRRAAKALLRGSGRRSVDVLEAAEKVRALARLAQGGFARDARAGPALWRLAPGRAGGGGALPVSCNRLEDVFKYDDTTSAMTRGAFIGVVMKRLEQGCQLFCYAPCDKLLLHCWAHAGAGQTACPPPARDVAPGATLLFDLQVHRDGASEDLVQRFVERIVAALDPAAAVAGVYYAGRLGAGVQRALRRCGFVDAAAVAPGAAR